MLFVAIFNMFFYFISGKRFSAYFSKHLRLLQWNHPGEDELLTMRGSRDSRTRYHYILPSFYKLLTYLKQIGCAFSVIFRTYGMDANNVLKSTAYSLNEAAHPSIIEPWDININTKPGKIQRTPGNIVLQMPSARNGEVKPAYELKNEREIYKLLSNLEGIHAFVDDFQTWQDHQYDAKHGKPFWLDLNDEDTHHIFFDDNIRVTDTDSIVDVRSLTDNDHGDEPLTADVLEDVCLVQADLLANISNENNFIEKVKLCVQNYETLLENRKMSTQVNN